MHNRISLIGNVGRDPEVRTVGETKVASFSLGVTEKGYTNHDGNKVDGRTDWFNVSLWRGLADIAGKYVKKGDKIFVAGKMQSREYEDKSGMRRTVWEVKADEIELLTPKNSTNAPSQSANGAKYTDIASNRGGDDLPF